MAYFRLAFVTRAKKLLDWVDKRTDRDSEASNIPIRLSAALRHHAANPREINPREMVTSGAWRGNIGGSMGLS